MAVSHHGCLAQDVEDSLSDEFFSFAAATCSKPAENLNQLAKDHTLVGRAVVGEGVARCAPEDRPT